jgi:hypothetical protein
MVNCGLEKIVQQHGPWCLKYIAVRTGVWLGKILQTASKFQLKRDQFIKTGSSIKHCLMWDIQNIEIRKQDKLQWLWDTSQINGDNLKNVRNETSTYFRNKKGTFPRYNQ